VIIILIKIIYSQIYVNFRILGRNGDEREKGEYTLRISGLNKRGSGFFSQNFRKVWK